MVLPSMLQFGMNKGGMIFQVIAGVNEGLYAQAPYRKQHVEFIRPKLLYVEYFSDESCTIPAMKDGKQKAGITKAHMLKCIGYYD